MRSYLSFSALLFLAMLVFAPDARALDQNCSVWALGENSTDKVRAPNGTEVGAVAVQCKETPGVIYYVGRDDPYAAARFISLATASLLSGKRLMISHNNSPLSTCQVGLQCYWLFQWSIWAK